MGRPKLMDSAVSLNVKIPEGMFNLLDAAARQENVKVSTIVREALSDKLQGFAQRRDEVRILNCIFESDRFGFFNLNEIAERLQFNDWRTPNRWRVSLQGSESIALHGEHCVALHTGNLWANRMLTTNYAMWASPKFSLEVIDAIDKSEELEQFMQMWNNSQGESGK